VDSTFDCDESYSWTFDENGDVDVKSEMKVMMIGDDKNINIDSLIETLGIDIQTNGANQIKIIKEVVEENSNDQDREKVEMKWTTEDENVFIDIDDNGNREEIKIINKVDDNGSVSVQKWVNGKEVEPRQEDLKKEHKVMMFQSDDGENIEIIKVGEGDNEVVVDMDVEITKDGENKHIVIISNISTKDIEKEMPEVATNITENKLEVQKLKFSPNPNNGKFDLQFKTENSIEPVSIKIFDLQGKEVYSETINKFNGKYSNNIDVSENGKGTYILQILQGSKSKTSKVVIK